MRTALGSSLLLLALSGVVALPETADAATICDAPDTTWVGPAAADGDRSWATAANWSNGVPTSTSAVCVPSGTHADPEVQAGTTVTVAAVDASAAGVDVSSGSLTVTGPWEAGRLHASGGEVVLGGASTLHDVLLQNSSDLVVTGGARLAADADIDAFEAAPDGGVLVTSSGELTLDDDASVRVSGLIVNHGVIRAEQGHLDLMGLDVQYVPPGAASDGTFIGLPGAELWLSGTVLSNGAVLDGITAFDVRVPADAEVTATGGARLWPSSMGQDAPGITGSGTVVMTGDSQLASGFADDLTLRVPQGEQALLDGWIGENAHAVVEGTALDRFGGLAVYDEATLDVESTGVLRMVHDDDFFGPERGGQFSSIVVHPGGTVVGGGALGSLVFGVLENHGTVRTEGGPFWLLDSSASVIDDALVGGRWEVGTGAELAFSPDGMSLIETITGNAAHVVLEGPGSSIHGLGALTDNKTGGTIELGGDASLSTQGSLTNHGQLSLDPGSTLSVAGDLTSTGDAWLGNGALVDVSGGFRNQGEVLLDAPASISAALGTDNEGSLTVLGGGSLALDGDLRTSGRVSLDAGPALSVDGDVDNTGVVAVSPGATLDATGSVHNAGKLQVQASGRVEPEGAFTQEAAGRLRIGVTDSGIGRVVAGGIRDLAGRLVLRLETGAWPPMEHRRAFVSAGAGAATPDDAFDTVRSPRRAGLTGAVRYRDQRVWVRVVDASA